MSPTPYIAAAERYQSPDGASNGGQAMIADADRLELSVVMPCLDEADTIATCVSKAVRALAAANISGEVIVADNGSTDGSRELAASHGARVILVSDRGYGAAIMGGIAAARGRAILMGDADDSYDYAELPKFVAKLREGNDLVQGCRLPWGGGTVSPGAMPVLHRWWGNPMFSAMARIWFRAPIHDVHCGMRAFTVALYESLDHQCKGMEFASENIIKASLAGARIAEVPITLHPDGRKAHAPHLRTFRDGWRHFRFYLMYSPRWLFLYPGVSLILAGLLAWGLAFPSARIGSIGFDVHTLLYGSLAIICGYQAIVFAVLTKVFAIAAHLLPADPRINRVTKHVTLETGLVVGALALLTGLTLLGVALNEWRLHHFGALDYRSTMRIAIPGVTLTALAVQTIFSSFYLSILALRRK